MRGSWFPLVVALIACGGSKRIAELETQLASVEARLAELEAAEARRAAAEAERKAALERRREAAAARREALHAREAAGGDPAVMSSTGPRCRRLDDGIYSLDEPLKPEEREPERFSRMARVRPHRDAKGVVDGMRLSGVRRDRLLYSCGLRSGDVVHEVNGIAMTGVDAMASLFKRLDDAPEVRVQLRRRGESLTLIVRVPPR